MSRKLVICNDHSWIKAQYRSKKRLVAGNATIAYSCVKDEDQNGTRQIALLQNEQQDCSSLSRPLRRFFGVGLKKEILTAYQFLVHNYLPGDDIYLIGSGRGAYSLQWLAEMISISGLLTIDTIGGFSKAYNYSKLTEEARRSPTGQALRDSFQSRSVRIRFLGFWDSVGSAGVPVTGLQHLSRLWIESHNGKLCENVDVACQALALDENNAAFSPHIWTGTKSSNFKKLEQVWFTGKHSNVTGGQRDSRLSDIALHWLLSEAAHEGLAFDMDKLNDMSTPDPLGCISEDSRLNAFTRWFRKRNYLRPAGIADTLLAREQIPNTEKIHTSIKLRTEKDPSYSPTALEILPPGTLKQSHDGKPNEQFDRQHERLQVNCPATLMVDDSRFNGSMLDYSSGGARIWIPIDLPIGTPITLRSSVLFDVTKMGHVVWTGEQSIGLQFSGEKSLSDLQPPPRRTLQ